MKVHRNPIAGRPMFLRKKRLMTALAAFAGYGLISLALRYSFPFSDYEMFSSHTSVWESVVVSAAGVPVRIESMTDFIRDSSTLKTEMPLGEFTRSVLIQESCGLKPFESLERYLLRHGAPNAAGTDRIPVAIALCRSVWEPESGTVLNSSRAWWRGSARRAR